MFSIRSTTLALALVSAACSFTPPTFQPSSAANLTVAFGTVSGINGVVLPRDATASAPELYTDQPLSGTYALLMVDPDIPAQNSSGITGTLLHWLQTGLFSSSEPTTIDGKAVYPLINPSNISALASYLQPTPPYRVPYSHRYVELLLDTTSMPNNSVLVTVSKTRQMFDVVGAVKAAGVNVVAGNWFNVTNAMFLANGSATPTGGPTMTSSGGVATTTTSEGRSLGRNSIVMKACGTLTFIFAALL